MVLVGAVWCFVIVSFAVPIWWNWRFLALYLRPPILPVVDAALPRACILLPLRGTDPHLRQGLHQLLTQDYPNYALHIVVDSPGDPAWHLVQDILSDEKHAGVDVKVTVLKEHCATCSLKLSAHAQAVEQLGDEFEIAALIDADALAPRNWLRTLVAALADPKVGVSTGIRWYAPPRDTWGALVRHLWNSASQTQMYAFNHPWGGSLAVRAKLLRDPEFIAEWKTCFCDDSGVGDLVVKRGYEVRFLPQLTMVNQEAIDLPSCSRFIKRQLLCPRMDLRSWPWMLAANVSMLVAVAICIAFIIAGIAKPQASWIAWFGGALALYFACQLPGLFVLENRVRYFLAARGDQIPPTLYTWKFLFVPVLTQLLQFYWLIAAEFARRTTWRGVDYRLDGQRRVRLVEYKPYQPPVVPRAANESVV
jgi:hypothetical protein